MINNFCSFKSKNHSLVEFISKENSMHNPKMMIPKGIIKEMSQDVEEENKK